MDSFCFNLGTAGIDPIHFLHLFFRREARQNDAA